MKKPSERLFSLLLTLAFLISCASGMALTVRADENDAQYEAPVSGNETDGDSPSDEGLNAAKGDPEVVLRADGADPVQAAKDLLAQIDSLQEMQDKKIVHPTLNEFNLKKPYYRYTGNGYTGDGSIETDNSAEHKDKQQRYAEYVENMFALRAQAKEAFDALTPEQQSELLADETAAANYAKLTPYDKLDTVFPAPYEPVPGHNYSGDAKPAPQSVPLPVTPSENEYTFETTMSYEMSQNFSAGRWKHQAANFSIFTLIDVSGPETEWSPDRLYEYNNCNYDLAYCCDANTLPHRSMHYKRVNLEDSGYYTEAAAQHIRAIANISYPFVNMDEMKQLLIQKGFPPEKANALTRSDMISAVQMAIWSYSNISTYLEPDYLENITHYGGTTEMIRLPDARYWLRTPTLHDYRNEMWIWYNSNTFPMENSYWAEPHWTFYDDIQDRVDSLVQFLHDLDPVAPAENEIVISDVHVTRSAPIDQNGTYAVDLSISLNHGASDGNVTITITSSNGSSVTNSRTITVGADDTYSTTVTVQDGDRVDIVADGTQVLPRGTYFYLPEAGSENSQALVGVAEGETRVHAEDYFEFHSEDDLGLRIFKAVKGSSIPLSGITLHAYAMETPEGELPQGDASQADIEARVKPENLAATVETDSTGYAFMKLNRGTYIIVEELNAEKVKEVVPPFYVNIPTPVETKNDQGEIIIEYLDVAEEYIDNPPKDIPGTVSVYLEAEKQFADWGKAGSFSFELEAVTPGAPMPSETIATAVEGDPVAVFPKIVYDAICFETGDPLSDSRVFEYTITEIDDGADGVTYDTTPHAVVVTVSRSTHIEVINNYGDEIVVTEYTAQVTYDGESSLIITNTFTPAAAHFEATKSFNDWGKADSFTFRLDAVTQDAPMPKKNTAAATEASPTAVFETLSFEKAGSYEYTITEIDDGADGVTYDTSPHKVVVTVTKREGNVLSASVSYDDSDSLIITNTYSPAAAVIEATKSFNDWGKADSFTFRLDAVTQDAPMPKKNTVAATEASPKAVFETLSFEKAGSYEYTITEIDDGADGVTYDITPHKVVVTVTKGEGNVLSASVAYDSADSLTITNTYSPATAVIEVTKSFNNWGKAKSFTFELEAVTADAPMPKENTAAATESSPTAVFETLTFEKAGSYEYTITEINDHVYGVTYDTKPHAVVVTVTKGAGNTLSAKVTYDGADSLTITNTYAPPPPPPESPETRVEIHVTKQLTGRAWKAEDSFLFHLAAVTKGAPMPPVTTSTATRENPVASFGSITYTEPGTYVYELWEERGNAPYVTYDTRVHKVIVTVTEDARTGQLRAAVTYDGTESLTVTNTYAPPPPPTPSTGDSSRPLLWLSLMVFSFLGILVVLRKLRRPGRA